jgi:hypothetical protein
MLKRVVAALAFLSGSMAMGPAHAVNLTAVPMGWRLENYPGDAVVLWFTGAPGCTNGRLALPASASKDDVNRLWSLILTAKIAQIPVALEYTGTGDHCLLSSFHVD